MSTQSLSFTRGDAWPFTLDQLTDLTGASVTDVTSWACRSTVRDITTNAIVAKASTTAAAGFTTITRGAGLFTWTYPAATTSAIAPNVYAFDVEATDASGNSQTVHGFITVLADQST